MKESCENLAQRIGIFSSGPDRLSVICFEIISSQCWQYLAYSWPGAECLPRYLFETHLDELLTFIFPHGGIKWLWSLGHHACQEAGRTPPHSCCCLSRLHSLETDAQTGRDDSSLIPDFRMSPKNLQKNSMHWGNVANPKSKMDL